MKTKEEIFIKHMNAENSLSVMDAALDAMEEYANQFKHPQPEPIQTEAEINEAFNSWYQLNPNRVLASGWVAWKAAILWYQSRLSNTDKK